MGSPSSSYFWPSDTATIDGCRGPHPPLGSSTVTALHLVDPVGSSGDLHRKRRRVPFTENSKSTNQLPTLLGGDRLDNALEFSSSSLFQITK